MVMCWLTDAQSVMMSGTWLMLGWSVGHSLRTVLPWKLLESQDLGRLGTTSQWLTFNAVVMKRPLYSVDISQNVLGVGLMMLQELSVQVTPD